MTTIAYKDKIIAYDSRAISGNIISYDDFDKKTERDGVIFFTCGTHSDVNQFVDLYFKKEKDAEIDCSALVIENNKVFQVVVDDSRLHKFEIDMTKPYAIGSGRDHAWTAMDLGQSAEKAVEMAIKRDWGSGGEIRVYEITD